MSKRIPTIILLFLMLGVCFILLYKSPQKVTFSVENSAPVFTISTPGGSINTGLWNNPLDDYYYVFLPSFSHTEIISIGNIDSYSIIWNSDSLTNRKQITFEEGEDISLSIEDLEGNLFSYNIRILHSANLPTLFIETENSDLAYIHENKNNVTTGSLLLVKSNGNTEFAGKISEFSGRGNSTWNNQKKPYRMKLEKSSALLGMDAGKTWVLLPSWEEGAKLSTKVAFDMAEAIGLQYSPQCEWVDLYINGEYYGIYYLSENINISDGRVNIDELDEHSSDISGGYLIEKDYSGYWEQSPSRFTTSSGYKFSIKNPSPATDKQLTYISEYVDSLDQKFQCADTIDFENDIDLESFARKYIIDEIAINMDISVTSSYFYKKRGDSKLYAGPVWDFDKSFGDNNSLAASGQWTDYTISVTDLPRSDKSETLPWYAHLCENEQFHSKVAEEFQKLLPHIKHILNTKIDVYASWTKKSIAMDHTRWYHATSRGFSPGHYKEPLNNVRYFKYYLYQRCVFLCERFGIEYDFAVAPIENGTTHTVTLLHTDGSTAVMQVSDGSFNISLPPDSGTWFYEHNGEVYSSYIPILEDVSLYAQ